jgi:hypothetical protein
MGVGGCPHTFFSAVITHLLSTFFSSFLRHFLPFLPIHLFLLPFLSLYPPSVLLSLYVLPSFLPSLLPSVPLPSVLPFFLQFFFLSSPRQFKATSTLLPKISWKGKRVKKGEAETKKEREEQTNNGKAEMKETKEQRKE